MITEYVKSVVTQFRDVAKKVEVIPAEVPAVPRGLKLIKTRLVRDGAQLNEVRVYTDSSANNIEAIPESPEVKAKKPRTVSPSEDLNRVLLKHKLLFKKAGRLDIAGSLDYKLRCGKAEEFFPKTSLKKAAEDVGLPGLTKVLEEKRQKAEAKGVAGAKEFLKRLEISELKLDQWLYRHTDMWIKDPQAAVYMLMNVDSKITDSHTNILLERFKIREEHGVEMEAYLQVKRLPGKGKCYEPPAGEWQQLVKARDLSVFDEILLMYPMIGPVKGVDPLAIGVIRDPSVFTIGIDELTGGGGENRLTWEMINETDINLGTLFHLADWE